MSHALIWVGSCSEWRSCQELASNTEEVKRRDKQLEFSMPRELFRGLAAVQRIAKDHSIKGVHGPLIELMAGG